jgi:hypothetical protein
MESWVILIRPHVLYICFKYVLYFIFEDFKRESYWVFENYSCKTTQKLKFLHHALAHMQKT